MYERIKIYYLQVRKSGRLGAWWRGCGGGSGQLRLRVRVLEGETGKWAGEWGASCSSHICVRAPYGGPFRVISKNVAFVRIFRVRFMLLRGACGRGPGGAEGRRKWLSGPAT